MASSRSGKTLTAMMRRVSGETVGQRSRLSGLGWRRGLAAEMAGVSRGAGAGDHSAAIGASADASDEASGLSLGSAVAVSVSDAIERLNLRELAVYRLELLTQALDVAVD